MKIVKIILFVIVGIVALLAIVAALVPKEYAVEREIVIDKPVPIIFEYTKYLKNQGNFSKWASMDPEMKQSYTGTDGEVGFVSRWESKNPEVGIGEQEILKIMENERLDYELRFYEPFESTANAFLSFEAQGENQTKVVWGLNSEMPYPMNLFLLTMDMDAMIGNDLQVGLDNLKALMEAMPEPVEVVEEMAEQDSLVSK